MEKTGEAVVVPLDAGWSDVGSWSALQDALPTDDTLTFTRGDLLPANTDPRVIRIKWGLDENEWQDIFQVHPKLNDQPCIQALKYC